MDVVDGRPHVAKVRVAGSNPVFRSKENPLLSRGFLYFKPWLGTILERLRVEGAMLWRWVSSSSGGGSPECFEWQCSYFAAEWRGFGHAGEYVACVESIAEAFSEEAKPARVAR